MCAGNFRGFARVDTREAFFTNRHKESGSWLIVFCGAVGWEP